jgi:16S rRNA (adenine1518-N6/adenine1519-N6)-dimethyltransferase
MNPSEILRTLNKFPNKKFGQNFLVDEKVLIDIVEAANLKEEGTVVEIGPGLGVLTEELSKKTGRVIAVEADRELADYLRGRNFPNTTVITGDALQVEWDLTIEGDYKIVANIPYSITSPLLKKIFSLKKKPSEVILLVQKELAERLVAKPKTRARGFMTVLREANAEAEIIRTVKPGSFYPAPQVDSAAIKLTPFAGNKMAALFWPIIEAGFRHKRQTLANALSADLQVNKAETSKVLEEVGLTTMARAEELSFEQWERVSKSFNSSR